MLDQLRRRLSNYQPRLIMGNQPQAGVLIALTDSAEPSVILTRRAAGLSSHSGEVAFPGGKYDLTDQSLLHTALREAEEEIGLPPEAVEIISPLGQVLSKHQLKVTPWVGVVPEKIELTPNLDELDCIFSVPLSFFLEDQRYRTDAVNLKGKMHYVPAYEYDGHIIWGLTAYMLVELMNVGFDAGIPMKPRPEHESEC